MFRDSIGAWRRKALLKRIVSTHNRGSGVRPRWRLSDKARRSVLLAGVAVLGLVYLAGPSWLTCWRVEAQ
ncbi:MAG: hypothetical protein KIT36_25100, partial [Alphaproteobacteria bacterium]|nr:hypothetical protein [Alphaproteobacteria bacterium]